jgi:membrane protease YdiL (CAAX protease family)
MSNASSNEISQRFGNPVWIIGKTLLIFVISQLIGGFLAGIFLGLGGVKDPLNSLDNDPLAEFLYILLIEILTVLLVALFLERKGWFFTKLRGLSLRNIGFGRRPKTKDLLWAACGFLIFYLLLIVVSMILGAIFPELDKGTQDVGFNHLSTNLARVVAFVGLVFLPPIGEETLVRGYLYTGLRQKMKFMPAMLITSLLFGAAHLETGTTTALLWAAGINTFILSLVLVYLREKTGALYAGMMIHALNNAVAFGFHFYGLMI